MSTRWKLLAVAACVPFLLGWGEKGHSMSGRVAGTGLPNDMPRFFREAAGQFEYLNPEPDRWRVQTSVEMNRAFEYDHYIDMEVVPAAAFDAPHRFRYLEILSQAGIEEPARACGLLPFRMLELYQRLQAEFSLWRRETDESKRRWIEQRILNDAGILGHYATDGANPHHTTVHHNGWDPKYPNPHGFSTEKGFHARFEKLFVDGQVNLGDLKARAPQVLANPRAAIWTHLRASHTLVNRLYALDKQAEFNATNTSADHKKFAVDRLNAGINMLRDLWWTAWVKSAS
jgi:hypothetical protein